MIGEPHLKILQHLDQPKSPTQLAEELDCSIKHTSETLSELRNIGLVTTEREGRHKIYRVIDARVIRKYRALVEKHRYIDFPQLLTSSYLHVAYHLDEKRTAEQLVRLSKPSRATVYRVLRELRNRGMVTKEDDLYAIKDTYRELVEFAQELAMLKNTSKLRDVFPGGRNHVVWNNDYEHIALVRGVEGVDIRNINRDEIDEMVSSSGNGGEYYLTGLEALRDREGGLKFLTTTGYHLFYTEDKDTVQDIEDENALPQEDIVCHTTLIHKRRIMGQRYTLLYLAKVVDELSEAVLRERAVHYDISREIDELLRYLSRGGRRNRKGGDVEELGLPEWSEFESLAQEYDVDVDDVGTEVDV